MSRKEREREREGKLLFIAILISSRPLTSLQGLGIMKYCNGDEYNGAWDCDQKCGHGTYTY